MEMENENMDIDNENEGKEQELCVIINQDAISELAGLGFIVDSENRLVKETDTGAVIVEPETGEVAAISDDGIITNEAAIIAGLVSSGMATIETVEVSDEEDNDDDQDDDSETDNDADEFNTDYANEDKSTDGSSVL